jgi:hypothetical protein
MSRSVRLATLAMLLGGWAVWTSAASAHPGQKVVSYHGYRLSVPAPWPVFDLAAHPHVCARFNRHAVYLGAPSAEQRCPAHAVGRTEAILITPLTGRSTRSGGSGEPRTGRSARSGGSGEPLTGRSARSGGSGEPRTGRSARSGGSGEPLPGAGSGRAQPRRGSSTRFVVGSRRLVVTATWGRHRHVIERALGRRVPAAAPAAPATTARSIPPTALPRAAAAARAATYTGLGFDPCATPSAGAMSAWLSSPYRAVGVYLGGANMACAQPNLTAAWVRAEEAAGWHLIPTYVGLQAPASSCGCAPISPTRARSQGIAAADDAIARAQSVGIGAGNPIYFDMEAYSRGARNTAAVLAFLAGWTAELHAGGYVSGVYSSGRSGITDLAAAYGTGYLEPDDIWIADWNGLHTVQDPYVPSGAWPLHQRLHQYSGGQNVTYGGVTMNIDGDYLDGAIAGNGGGPLLPDGTFVQVAGTTQIYRIAGGAPLLTSGWDPFGGPQPVAVLTQQQFDSLLRVPADRTFLVTTTGAIYRIAGGSPIAVSSWSLFGGVKPFVTIDQWDIDNIANPAAHLNAKPVDGTVVEGLPSHTFWGFSAGNRARLSPTSGAIPVDDAGLNTYVQVAVLSGSAWCVVPGVRHMPLKVAVATLRRAHCRVGTVRRPRHVRRHHLLRVRSQSAARGSRHRAMYVVNLTVA